MSFNPVGHAHDIRGLLSVIFGAGKHKCEQCPFTAWQKFSPSGCRYGWYTWMVIGCWSCSRVVGRNEKKNQLISASISPMTKFYSYHVEGGDGFNILSIEFICPENSLLVPICPIHPIFKCGDWERMSKGVGGVKNNISSRSVVITRGNHIQFSIDLRWIGEEVKLEMIMMMLQPLVTIMTVIYLPSRHVSVRDQAWVRSAI